MSYLKNLIIVIILLIILCGISPAADTEESVLEYRIGIGDMIQISVYKYEEFTVVTMVGPDGKITMPLLGDLAAAGFTKNELKSDIVNKLSKFIKEPTEVTVIISQFNSQKISVFGRVANQKTFSFSIIPSLLEIIIQAIPNPDADLTAVKIIPADPSIRKPIIVNLANALQNGDISQLPKLHSGDTIYVPEVEKPPVETTPVTTTEQTTQISQTEVSITEQFIVNVMGAITAPGSYTFTEKPTLPQVLMRAGSVTDNMALRDIRVIRGGTVEGNRIIHVNMDKYLIEGDNSLLPNLYSGDLVYVPPTTQENVKGLSITITGEVIKAGNYAVSEPIDILDMISMAGGLTPNADPERIRIRRETPGYYQDKVVNINEFMKDIGSSSPPEMVGPGYRIYVPVKQRNPAITTATVVRGMVMFLADLIPIYGMYRLIRE